MDAMMELPFGRREFCPVKIYLSINIVLFISFEKHRTITRINQCTSFTAPKVINVNFFDRLYLSLPFERRHLKSL